MRGDAFRSVQEVRAEAALAAPRPRRTQRHHWKQANAAFCFLVTVAAVTLAGAAPAQPMPNEPDSLAEGFRNPPQSARPRVWWHWMNGNVTEEGITNDLEWMKRIGIGGLQNFDASLSTPQVVDKRLAYMTPEWKHAFRHAAALAERLGLEFAIATSPGFSETGGPWVDPKDGLKKLVWSETRVSGGKRYIGRIAAPPAITGPFQSLRYNPGPTVAIATGKVLPVPAHYADIAVLAFPETGGSLGTARITDGNGAPFDATALSDDDLHTATTVRGGTVGEPGAIVFAYDRPQRVRSATLFLPGEGGGLFGQSGIAPRLEASDDGVNWRPIATFVPRTIPTTVSFPEVSASRFRLIPGAKQGNGPAKTVKVGSFLLSAQPRVDQFETKAGFAIARDYFALGANADRAERGLGPGTVVDLTAKMQPDGSIDWMPPRGNWRILRLGYSLTGTTNHPAPAEATGLEVDKFDGAAVRGYLETYLGMYRDAAGESLVGKRGVRALVTDSIESGPANWTPRLIEQFRRLRGYDPLPHLPALTGVLVGSRADSDAFLYDFRRTLADLIASEHYGTIARVAKEHGLTVYGEALESGRPSIGDDMAMRSHADFPMAAMWAFKREAGPKLTYIADINGAASVAHLYGRNIVAAESLTSMSPAWSDAPADLRRAIDLAFVTGVTRPVIHTSVHQPSDDKVPGLSLYFIGQFFTRHETWAEMAKPWVDYLARSSFLLQQGRNVADVAYFYGEEGPLTGLFGDSPIADAPTRHGYDFVNADVLANVLSVEDGQLVAASGARYRLLYLGGASQRMSLATLRRIATLVQAGATALGVAPEGPPGLGDDTPEYRALVEKLWSESPVTRYGNGRVIKGRDLEAALASIDAQPDFSYLATEPGSQLLFTHRRLADGDTYFITNRLDRADRVEARFRVAGKQPEIWRADAGTIEPVSYRIEGGTTIVPLSFEGEESYFVIFRKPAAAASASIPARTLTPVANLTGPWEVKFQPGRGAPPSIEMPRLGSHTEQGDPGVRFFSGVATYTKKFELPPRMKPGGSLVLDLGTVGDIAEVYVNGRLAGSAWHGPYRMDIGKALRRGTNRIEIRVANLWFNRLVGDAQPGAKKVAFTTIRGPAATSALRPSGLIGPVRLFALEPPRGSEDRLSPSTH